MDTLISPCAGHAAASEDALDAAQYAREQRARDIAHQGHHVMSEIEIDGDAKVTFVNGGAWVQAWVWVPDEEIDE